MQPDTGKIDVDDGHWQQIELSASSGWVQLDFPSGMTNAHFVVISAGDTIDISNSGSPTNILYGQYIVLAAPDLASSNNNIYVRNSNTVAVSVEYFFGG